MRRSAVRSVYFTLINFKLRFISKREEQLNHWFANEFKFMFLDISGIYVAQLCIKYICLKCNRIARNNLNPVNVFSKLNQRRLRSL